ncbi:uncharacterized protein TRIADDRAFT_60080 [Trichoplax adhaerens]|uniref:G-protein coupled receptors family 1 profile domain-containing protein n=1 Tax=Trichoplax adhaerens TaxID=10228 RepID=B3S789_TRIAD|nr:hypothetical protein TRIADDRAFT_60080 [Trichoplax adhaerens]EDV21442.1 hypothetical protein TRIADDRAFT_60080 [Trichoplax adhaerens]|eukprot:XP_002116042.1 hypothetical protein TRIADDRAFT_60080 [Trichoplax adhaerens]
MTQANQSLANFFSVLYASAAIAVVPLSVIGLLANLFVLYIFITEKFFRKVTYQLILISATTDTISSITYICVYSQIAAKSLNLTSGTIMCKCLFFITMTSYAISIMNLSLIALDRYFAIVKPWARFYRLHRNQFVMICEVIIWIMAIIINFPLLIIGKASLQGTVMCDITEVSTLQSVYFIAFAVLLYILPSFAISIIYWRIIVHQKNYVHPGHALQNQLKEMQMRKKKFITALISITTSYILTTWPFFATAIGVAVTQKTILQIRESSSAAFLLAFFSYPATTSITIWNPFIYLKFDYNVRASAKAICQRVGMISEQRVLRMMVNEDKEHQKLSRNTSMEFIRA